MHSVELVLDDRTDAAIRDEWAALLDAGLPSQGRHRGASNRPHVTVALADTLVPGDLSRLAAVAADLPLPVTVGGLLIFGGRRFVLARLAVPGPEILRLQGAMLASLAEPADPHGHFSAGRWTPHITLARRLSADEVASAVQALGEVAPFDGTLTAARRWDIMAKQEHWIDPEGA